MEFAGIGLHAEIEALLFFLRNKQRSRAGMPWKRTFHVLSLRQAKIVG